MIFFDLDGTLLDHKNSETLGIKAFYEKYKGHFELGEESFYQQWCQISNKNFNRFLKGELTFDQQRIERIKEIFGLSNMRLTDSEARFEFEEYLSVYENNWKPFEDVVPCLQELTTYKLGIISNGDLEQQSLKLERMGIKHFFTDIITAGEVGIAKPNIELFMVACNRANTHPQECWYIGDDLYTDILPCEEAGIKGIWLNRKREPLSIKTIRMIHSLDDIKRHSIIISYVSS